MSELSCVCQSCDIPFNFDLLVPDDVWDKIRPAGVEAEGGLLCPSCIVKALAGIGWPCAKLHNPHAASPPPVQQGEAVNDGPISTRLAQAAMDLIHHDAQEPELSNELRNLEREFRRILAGRCVLSQTKEGGE